MLNLDKIKKLTKNKAVNYGVHSAILIYLFCTLFGITSTIFFNDIKLVFFLGSILFAVTIIYMRDNGVHYKDENDKKGHKSEFLVIAYTLIYGGSALYLLSGAELGIFLTSYMFAITMFYFSSPERIYGVEVKLNADGVLERQYLKKDIKYYISFIFNKSKKQETTKAEIA